MKTITLILILFAKCTLAQSTVKKVPVQQVKAASVIIEAMTLDSIIISTPDQLLHLPAALTVATCDVGLASQGSVYKVPYEKTATGKFPQQVLDMLKMAKSGDELIFEDVYVMKGDKKLRLADKSILIH